MSDENDFDFDGAVDSIGADLFGGSDETDIDNELSNNEQTGEQQEAEAEKTADNVTEEQQQEVPAKAPPASWAKEQHEHWSKMTPEAQAYVELREKQMLDGIEQYKANHAYAQELQRTIEPYRDMLQQFGLNEHQVVENSLGWNRALTSGSVEARQQAFIKLGTDLGIIPQEGQPQIDPRTQELQQRVERMERESQQRQQAEYQQNYSKVASEVEAFASDPEHPYFEEVADDVIALLQTGLDLKDAYEKAVWANPITRAKEQSKLIESETAVRLAKQTAEAKAAQKAKAANVKPINSNRQSAEPVGSWDDTMAETLAKLRAG
ncbi:MAG: hypothetical protein M0R47_16590 [Methylobacter sp.]|uniref:hypothetical protein n=1 Tax=Methylobacter sp. TaxID=2051955 RepID=UPI0025F90C70|nr:hypothetical protein [Methylobacter sp.]MCK9622140.1 hypothetical protein [Methylobacter sp.]